MIRTETPPLRGGLGGGDSLAENRDEHFLVDGTGGDQAQVRMAPERVGNGPMPRSDASIGVCQTNPAPP